MFFFGKNVLAFASGRGLRGRSEVGFSCVGFVGKRKASLLTELENMWMVFYNDATPPGLRAGFLFDRDPRRRKGRKSGASGRCPKQHEPFIFT
ncbi:MAG: hypothetical protein D6714_06910 [Bacteroidetes bacterium]|nr:MAG: hypothetical protein D6714_06910 [Bacteroidota bacterium]